MISRIVFWHIHQQKNRQNMNEFFTIVLCLNKYLAQAILHTCVCVSEEKRFDLKQLQMNVSFSCLKLAI